MAAKLTKKEQAAADAEALRISALPMPREGEAYDPVRHPSVLLDKADLGVSYETVEYPILVTMSGMDGRYKFPTIMDEDLVGWVRTGERPNGR